MGAMLKRDPAYGKPPELDVAASVGYVCPFF
jgi:hypothetical protein